MSQWADRYRKLSSESSAEPGQWDTARAEFQRGIMDAINDPTVDEIWVMKSAQVGWTEILNNAGAYFMDQDPSPIILVQPTGAMAEAWSKDRLAPMLRDTPKLQGKVSDERTRDGDRGNTIKQKRFPGGHLTMIGANSPSSLSMRPIRVILLDEVDRYPKNVGAGDRKEGNVIRLVIKRSTTFWNRKILGGSTPTIKGVSEIEARYERSDQRKYFVPCPHCNEYQVLKMQNFKWDKGPEGEHLCHTAKYMCEHCATLIDEKHKHWMVKNGQWRATKPFNGIAGFHIWEAYSPWVAWHELCQNFVDSKAAGVEEFQTFVNTSLGETWSNKGKEIDAKGLPARREHYDLDHIPDRAVLLTAGVDVQDNRLEVGIDAWGEHEENWKFPQIVLRGDPSQDEVWLDLDRVLGRKYRCEDGRELYIESTCVDSGGHHTQKVYEYCIHRKQYRIFAIKGTAGTGALGWPKHPSQVKMSRIELFVIGTDTIKDLLFNRLVKVVSPEEPGYTHFSSGCDDEYFRQLTSEAVIEKYVQGRKVRYWQPKKSNIRQEVLDCWVYAYAAMLARAADLKARALARATAIQQSVSQVPFGGAQPTRQRRVRSSGITL